MKKLMTMILVSMLLLSGGCGKKRMSRTDKAQLYYDAAVGYLNKGDAQNAIDNLKAAYDLDKDNPQIMHVMGLAYFQMGVPETALTWLMKACAVTPDDPELNNNIASVYLVMNQYDKSITHSSKALANPDYRTPAAAYFNRGIASMRLDKPGDAEKDFRSAMRHEPLFDKPRVELGRIMLRNNRYDDAVQMLSSAIKANASNPETYLLRGQALWHQGYVSRAEADFNKILYLENAGPEIKQQAHDWLEKLR